MAKCKICGARMDDGAARCPMCGAAVGATAESLQPKPQDQPRPQARQTPPVQQQWPPSPVQQTVTVQMPPPQSQTNQYATSGDATENELIDAYISGSTGVPARTHALDHYRGAFCSSISWNWATAFVGPLNFFYRRCWGWALLLYLLAILLGLTGFGVIVYIIIMGLVGDRIIYSRYKRTAQQALLQYPGNRDGQLSYVAGQGGTRTGIVITIIIISVLIGLSGFFVAAALSS